MKTKIILVSMMLVCLTALGSHAQVQPTDPSVIAAEWQAVLVKAMDSAVLENGRLRSLKIALPNDRERSLTVEYAQDNRSFTLIDEGRKTRAALDEAGRISEIVFPDGKNATFVWDMAPNGYWIPSSIKIDGKKLGSSNSILEQDCRAICERAAHASLIAIGVCAAGGPLSLPCMTSLAVATAATYQCYRCANPEVIEPCEN